MDNQQVTWKGRPMDNQQVTWKGRLTNFTGRNGWFRCGGLDIQPLEHNQSVMIAPLTSQGVVGRCDIEIPLEALPEVVAKLQALIVPLLRK
jgi:hypothetical protein